MEHFIWCREKTPILVSITKSTKYTDVLDQYILIFPTLVHTIPCPDSKVHEANWGPSGADRTQVGPMLAPWTLLSGFWPSTHKNFQFYVRFFGILWHRRCSTHTLLHSPKRHCVVYKVKNINDSVGLYEGMLSPNGPTHHSQMTIPGDKACLLA